MKFSLKNFFKDVFALLLLGSVGVYFGWLFYQDLNYSLDNQDGEVLGTVLNSTNNPQRKFDGRTLWASLDNGSPLYLNDTIKTYEEDRIVLLLNDGTELLLEPNSMIRLEGERISFNGGSISAINRSGESSIEIATEDGDLLTLDQGAINLEQQEGEELSFSVSEGSAILSSKDGTEQQVEENQNVTLGDQGPQFDRFTIELDAPALRSYWVSYDEQQTIGFRWTSPEEEEYRFLLSDTPDFENILIESFQTERSLDLPLTKGNYYWKVEAQGQRSNSSSLTVLQELPPLLRLPSQDQVFSYRSQVPRIPLQWDESLYAHSYLVELSNTSDFSSVVLEREVQSNFLFLEDLNPQEYWWRVSPARARMSSEEWLAPVEIGHFTLEQNLDLEPVDLLFPQENGTMNPLSNSQGIRFSWAVHAEAKQYRLEISETENFSSNFFEIELESNNHFLDLPPIGDYHWRVGGISYDGLEIPYSESQTFQVIALDSTLSLMEPLPEQIMERNTGEVQEFRWQSQNRGFFRIQLWHSPWNSLEETLIEDSLTMSQTSMAVLPAPGKYRWRVSLVNEQGDLLDNSDDRFFYLEEPFLGPEIYSPMDGASFRMIGQAELELEWEDLGRNRSYVAGLYYENSDTPVREFRSDGDTLWNVENLDQLLAGSYTLRVQALRDDAPQGFPAVSAQTSHAFRIDEIALYSPTSLIEPQPGTTIEQVDFLRSGILFRWNQETRVNSHELRIFAGADQEAPLYSFPLNQSYYRIRELPPGQYFWDIKSQDNQGFKAPDSERRSFTLRSLAELNRPAVLSPLRGEVVDMTDKDELYFQWRAVSGAEFYRLSLYNSQGDLIFQNNRIEGTEWSIEDLSILDVGEFQLELQAESFYEDLGLTRSSLPLRQEFSISLEALEGIPQIITTDVQYSE